MENLENNVVNNEVQENTEVKTYTQEEVNKMLKGYKSQEEVNKIVADRLAREQRKQQEMQEKLIEEESEKLAKMTEAERVKAKAERDRKKFEDKVAKFQEEMKAFEQEKIKNQTMKLLDEKGLPIELCQFIQSNTADEIMENVEVFEKCWSEAIEKSVNARLRTSGELKTSTTTKSFYTVDQLKNMSVDEINKNWDKIKNNFR